GTRERPAGDDTVPAAPGVPGDGAGTHALDSTLAEVDHDDGAAADRRRRAGALLLVLAALLLLGAVVALLLL
ncbi:hypothetical protein, partial [Pseudonocardia sp. SID8383]